jgi:hypothetical protein
MKVSSYNTTKIMKNKNQNNEMRALGAKKLAKRLGAYSAAAAATAVATQSTANAAEVVHDIADLVSNASFDVRFNLISGAAVVEAATYSGYQKRNIGEGSIGFGAGGTYIYAPLLAVSSEDLMGGFANPSFAGGAGNSTVYASGLAPSNSISAGLMFGGQTSFSPSYGNYAYVGSANGAGDILGIQFSIGGATHYGWAQITISGADTTLHGFGYNSTPGAASHAIDTIAAAVPEPSSIMLFAMGAAGLGMRRKRKAA